MTNIQFKEAMEAMSKLTEQVALLTEAVQKLQPVPEEKDDEDPEAKDYKGGKLYPKWLDPDKHIGDRVNSSDELVIGNLYIIFDWGLCNWHGDYKYMGKNSAKEHRFKDVSSPSPIDTDHDSYLDDLALASEIAKGKILNQKSY